MTMDFQNSLFFILLASILSVNNPCYSQPDTLELPFVENWNSGSFNYNGWTTSSDNWIVDTQMGNPSPTAAYHAGNDTVRSYTHTLKSAFVNSQDLLIGTLQLDFQLKLNAIDTGSSEKFAVKVNDGDSWTTLYERNGEVSFDWDSIHLDITLFGIGKVFQIAFETTGENPQNIQNWYVDNIEINRICLPPCPISIEIDTIGNDEYSLFLNWECPLVPPDYSQWIRWDDGVNFSAFGTGIDMSTAIRWEANQYNDLDSLYMVKVQTYIQDSGFAHLVFNIWEGPEPLNVLYTDTLESYTYNDWNMFSINDSLMWDKSKEYWIGFTYLDRLMSASPAGMDMGPAVSGFGDLISVDGGVWESLADYDLDYNWNIAMYLEDPDFNTSLQDYPKSLNNFEGNNIYLSINGSEFEYTWWVPYFEGEFSYNIDGILTDGNNYCFMVTSVYENETDYCESEPAVSQNNPDENFVCAMLVGVENERKDISDLVSIHPNPFSTSTTIEYQLDRPSKVTLAIYNHLGEQVDLIRQNQQQGKQKVVWNAEGLPPGMYFFTLKAGDQVATGKMVLVR